MKKIFLLYILSILVSFNLFSQQANKFETGAILHNLKKLQHTARVMYIAAHPDDENTSLISYFENKRYYETAYLSLTRGDGGQNVIGPELREGLGIIRTQELLAARSIDGGEQYFTRANDFGYSKNPVETLSKWDEDKVLADVVWAIRKFQPDVIITRFNKTPGITHGHHTSSAILADKAFNLAGDPQAFSDQLQYVSVWQPKHIFWNTSTWFYGDDFPEDRFIKLNVGGYNPYLGISYPEIAGKSRSQHKSQAFGTAGRRGVRYEYFEQWDGDKVSNQLFEDINTKWENAYANGDRIDTLIKQLITSFSPHKPESSIPMLLKLQNHLKELKNQDAAVKSALNTIHVLIQQCLGLYMNVSTQEPFASPGDSVSIYVEIVNRSGLKTTVNTLSIRDLKLTINQSLGYTDKYTNQFNMYIPNTEPYSNPYWLNAEHNDAMYTVEKQELIGKPENEEQYQARVSLLVDNHPLKLTLPVYHRNSDRVKGEYTEPFYIIPRISLKPSDEILLFKDNTEPKELKIEVKAHSSVENATLEIHTDADVEVKPSRIDQITLQEGEVQRYTFTIQSNAENGEYSLSPKITLAEKEFTQQLQLIDYEHIPKQIYLKEASVDLVQTSIKKTGKLVGYIPGAGDVIPESLRTIGYSVKEINIASVSAADLSAYDAIIAGIRAYNTNIDLQKNYAKLNRYVEEGGTYVVQYNTTYSLPDTNFWPKQLTLSRNRITDENSEFTFVKPEHHLLNTPNKITQKDFSNWVQERGLYFPSSWDEKYIPLLKGHDLNEEDLEGALLYLEYGRGVFIYTGLSFFRELPAGVPGAYRLLANLVSARQNKDEN